MSAGGDSCLVDDWRPDNIYRDIGQSDAQVQLEKNSTCILRRGW